MVNDVAVRSGPQNIPSVAVAAVVVLALITTGDAPIGARGLTVTCLVDGRVTQRASTSGLVFDGATVIAHLGSAARLLPGDLITPCCGRARSESWERFRP